MRYQAELTVPRLCTDTPTAGGRVLETGDEKLLQLARQAKSTFLTTTLVVHLSLDGLIFTEPAPVVVVFTKYDKLFRSKKFDLQETRAGLNPQDVHNRAREEARTEFDIYVQSFHNAIRKMDSTMEMPPWTEVSSKTPTRFRFLSVDLFAVFNGYDADISSLVQVTSNVVKEKLKDDTWLMWAIAQRVSLSLNVEACIS
jgi:hypothetical protein